MTSEQSSVNGEWYNHYDTLLEAKENCLLLPETFQRACQLFCELNLKSFRAGKYEKVDCC